jgi:tetratricopeptide (TPR) repeat protein
VAGQAYLLHAGFRPEYDNSAMSMDRLRLFDVRIDSNPENIKPVLSEEQLEYTHKALVIGDWIAGALQDGSLEQMEVAEICARALALQGDYQQSIESYRFALSIVQRDRISEGAPDPHRAKRADLLRQRDHVQRIWDIQRYAIEYVLFREADSLRRRKQYDKAITAYVKCIEAADNTMLRLLEAQLSSDFGALQEAEDAADRRRHGEIDEKPDPDESPYTAAAKFHIGLCLIGLEQYPQAVRHFDRFIKSDPGNAERAGPSPAPAQKNRNSASSAAKRCWSWADSHSHAN